MFPFFRVRKSRRITLVVLGLLLALAGCSSPANLSEARSRGVMADGTAVTVAGNPFLQAVRNSSDPAAVYASTPEGPKVLLVTSSDLRVSIPIVMGPNDNNHYPMDKTYLYAMDPSKGTNTWTDFGAIISEAQIPWANDNQDHLWAPDIDTKGNDYFVFVPARIGSTQNQRIAVFKKSGNPFPKPGNTSDQYAYNDYVHLNLSGGGEQSYSYDPGVFHLGTAASDYYIVYCDQQYPDGRIQIARFTNDGLTQATNLGKVVINGLPGVPNGTPPNFYMEGPDLFEVYPTSGDLTTMVYLQFAAKFNGSEQEYIGYAYKRQADFVADPANGWTFGGWIQKQIDPDGDGNPGGSAEWTNHATIVSWPEGYSSRYMYLYQYGTGDTTPAMGQMRQVSMRELHINNDLDRKIQGVTPDDPATGFHYLGHEPYPFQNIVYTGQTADADAAIDTSVHPWFYINNETSTSLFGGWVSLYFIKTENGKTPVLEAGNTPGFTKRLRQFGPDVWVVELYNSGGLSARRVLPRGSQVPNGGPGYDFSLHYSDNSTFVKSNDPSSPLSNAFTDTDKLPLIGVNGRIAGINPKMRITNNWNQNTGRTLTASPELVNGENVVVAQPSQGQDWDTQQWEIEPIPGTDEVRIKVPVKGTYLNVTTQNEREKVTLHAFDVNAQGERWIIRPDGTIQNVWTGKFLTRGDPSQYSGHDRDDYISVWNQNRNTGWASQVWTVAYY